MIAENDRKLVHELNLDADGQNLVAAVTPPAVLDIIRRRADLAVGTIARASARRWALWGWFFILGAVLLATASLLVSTRGLIEGTAAAAMFLGILCLVLVEPRQMLTSVENFHAFCDQAEKEWRTAASGRARQLFERWQEIVTTFVREQQARRGLSGGQDELHEAIDHIKSVERHLDAMFTAAVHGAESGTESVAAKRSQMRQKVSSWLRRFRVGAIRTLARQTVEAQEKNIQLKHKSVVFEALKNQALSPLVQLLQRLADALAKDQHECVQILADARAALNKESIGNQNADGAVMWPPERDIKNVVRDSIAERLPGLRSRVASRPPEVPLAQEIEKAVGDMVASQPVVSEDFKTQFERGNGQGRVLLSDATAVAREWSHHNDSVHPGEPHWRMMTLLCDGGENSPIFKALKKHADGMVVRGLHVAQPDEIQLICESRWEKPSSHPRLAQCAKSLEHVTREQLALMTPLEDVEFLRTYTPEQPDPKEQVIKVMAMALALGVIVRDGSVLRAAPGQGVAGNLRGGRIGGGWDQAIANLASDGDLRRQIETQVRNTCEAKGAKNVAELISEAMKRPDLVPAAHIDTVSRLLAEERDRLIA